MTDPDFNLLIALDALLAEGSVTGAAEKLGLSVSAMSRTVKRLRAVTGDPLLVRAGRGLVPTPYADTLRARVHEATHEVHALLAPSRATLDLQTLDTTFSLRTNAAFVEFLGTALLARLQASAPRTRLRFLPKTQRTAGPLRDGNVDLEIGRIESLAPEIRTQVLFEDRLVCIGKTAPFGSKQNGLSMADYASARHVVVSPSGNAHSPIDDALAPLGLARNVVCVVPAFADAIRIARTSELIATVPHSCLGCLGDLGSLGGDDAPTAALPRFDLPLPLPSFTIRMAWHPRTETEPARRWLREQVVVLCRESYPPA